VNLNGCPRNHVSSNSRLYQDTTRFALNSALCATNCIPQIVEEIKPRTSDEEKKWMSLVNSVYTSDRQEKGTQKQSIRVYNFFAPLMGVGEFTVGDRSSMDRYVLVHFSKKNSKPYEQNYHDLMQLPLERLGNILLKDALNISDEDLINMLEECQSIIKQKSYLVDRPLWNASIVLFGLKKLAGLAGEIVNDDIVNEIISSFHVNEEDSQSNVDIILEHFKSMSELDPAREDGYAWGNYALKSGLHYMTDFNNCYINLTDAWLMYSNWCHHTGAVMPIRNRTDFMKQIEHHALYVDKGVRKRFEYDKQKRYLVLKREVFDDEIVEQKKFSVVV